jgi:phosphoribosyl 1,2-cyclic phosphodiesterase
MDIKILGSSSKGNCYLLDDGSTKIMLECGVRFKDIQRGFDFALSDIEGCLITHEHGDHIKSLPDVLKAGVNCYMSPGTADATGVTHHRIKRVKMKDPFHIGTWKVLPFDVEHDVAEPTGYLLASKYGHKVLFLTDTYYCRYRFNGITHLLLECNYSLPILDANIEMGITPRGMRKRLLKSHFSLENVIEFLKVNDLSKIEEIYLLHLSDSNSDADLFKEEVARATGKLVFIA